MRLSGSAARPLAGKVLASGSCCSLASRLRPHSAPSAGDLDGLARPGMVAAMLRLPPYGPRGRLRTTIAVAREPYAASQRWRDEFGPTYMMSVMSGRYLVTGEPEVVRDVFRANPAELYPAHSDTLGPLVGPRSLFVLEPSEHDAERRLIAPSLGRGAQAYTDTVREVAMRHLEALHVGDTCLAGELSRQLSAEVIARAVFGARDELRVQAYRAVIARWLDAWRAFFIWMPSTQHDLFGLSPWAKFVKAGTRLNAMLTEDIAARRGAPERFDDILGLLLATRDADGKPLSDEVVCGHLRSLLFAGHETTTRAMTWVLHHVVSVPRLYDRMRTLVVGRLESVLADEWFDAVVNEALRLYPVVTGAVRVMGEQSQLGPFMVPAGTKVLVSLATLHTDPKLYPDPEQFQPERFLSRKYEPYEFAPFGGGNRRCLGATLATLETKAAIATLLRYVQFEHQGPRGPNPSARVLPTTSVNQIRLRVVGKG